MSYLSFSHLSERLESFGALGMAAVAEADEGLPPSDVAPPTPREVVEFKLQAQHIKLSFLFYKFTKSSVLRTPF